MRWTTISPRGDLPANRAVHWLRVLADTWVNAGVREAKADLLHAIYDRIVVKGRSIVAARLTPAASRQVRVPTSNRGTPPAPPFH